jgi:hypothetical protein
MISDHGWHVVWAAWSIAVIGTFLLVEGTAVFSGGWTLSKVVVRLAVDYPWMIAAYAMGCALLGIHLWWQGA